MVGRLSSMTAHRVTGVAAMVPRRPAETATFPVHCITARRVPDCCPAAAPFSPIDDVTCELVLSADAASASGSKRHVVQARTCRWCGRDRCTCALTTIRTQHQQIGQPELPAGEQKNRTAEWHIHADDSEFLLSHRFPRYPGPTLKTSGCAFPRFRHTRFIKMIRNDADRRAARIQHLFKTVDNG